VSRPDLSNWLDAEHNRWSLRNARELIPTGAVAPSQLPRGLYELPAHGLLDSTFESNSGPRLIREFLLSSRTDSLTVVRGDTVLAEWRVDGFAPQDVHLIFSVTKSVTSLLTGALVKNCGLNPEAPITHYLPQIASSAFGDATVRNLLDMTVSFKFVEDYTPGPDVRDYRYAVGWYPAPWDAPRLHEFIATRQKDGQHGTRFRYLSPATDLLGWVCEAVSGLPYHEALSRFVWQPMGAEHEANMTLDRDGSPRAAGGLSVIPRDMARIGMLIRDGGYGAIDSAYLEDIFTGGSHAQWAIGDFADVFEHGVYRSCCYRPGEDPDVVMGIGIYGQMLYVDRPRGVVIAKQSSWAQPDEAVDHNDAYRLCRTIARMVG
jgi:CubicO group peptidase (beta-lactamase class C family)